ncbi:unknown protein [Desulfotalea psychrophila LSv54]|uniref:Uncharacterized protein n=1 Tax=Desulfotalea psychrophila (strain LSv54 / DSM 12343) TaxID=177439 RepID=Q6ALF7_DESPS|nr:unknown protein [Desulfotalea psychrophila LSv54]
MIRMMDKVSYNTRANVARYDSRETQGWLPWVFLYSIRYIELTSNVAFFRVMLSKNYSKRRLLSTG